MRKPLSRALSSILALGVAACGGGGGGSPAAPSQPAPTPAPTPTPIVYDGNWSGQTSQNQSLSFVVSGNRITQLRLSLRFQGGGCTVSLTSTVTASVPIDNGAFTMNVDTSSLDLTLRGTFSSPTALAGDGNARYKSSSFCNGLRTNWTYTAAK